MGPFILLGIVLLITCDAPRSVALESTTTASPISSTVDATKDANEHLEEQMSDESDETTVAYLSDIIEAREIHASTLDTSSSIDSSESSASTEKTVSQEDIMTASSTSDSTSTTSSTSSTVEGETQSTLASAQTVDGSTSKPTQEGNQDRSFYDYRVNPVLLLGRFIREAVTESLEDSSDTESAETEDNQEDFTDSPAEAEGYQEESKDENMKGAETGYFMQFPYWYPRQYYEPRHWPSYRRRFNYLRYPIFAGR